MTALIVACPPHRLVDSGSAVSEEAGAGRKATSAVEEEEERSYALFGRKAAAIAQVWAVVDECEEPGWDGDRAEPISEIAAHTASNFIRALPEDFPLPEIAPEPDGAISLDWLASRHRLFSLSVGESYRLPYAWIDGPDEGYGVALFDGGTVPEKILEGIRGIARRADASIWAR